MDVTSLDGRNFAKFVAAGTYFLRKYRGVLNDLNVFPVPDGDTGSNLYLTATAALAEARRTRHEPLSSVAAAVARGSLFGARGNSGVIFSQMLRGFAGAVDGLAAADATTIAAAMLAAAVTARAALHRPVEGTMISVADAVADAAGRSARAEPDLRRLAGEIVRSAAAAVDRTPEQLPVLKEAGVVDSGGAGILYFLEGLSRFSASANYATGYPRSVSRVHVFAGTAPVAAERYCTEFVLEDVDQPPAAIRAVLEEFGDSLVVAGEPPLLKIHVHTADPSAVRAALTRYGRPTREKVEDMDRQHRLLLVDGPPAYSVVAVVPGLGFGRILRELGVESTVHAAGANPSVGELVAALDATLAESVYLLPNDPNVHLAAREAAALSRRTVWVVPTRDVGAGLAVALALSSAAGEAPSLEALSSFAEGSRSAAAFFAGRDSTVGGVSVARGQAVAALEGRLIPAENLGAAVLAAARALDLVPGDVVSLYRGEGQNEADARRLAEAIATEHPDVEVETYAGGQRSSEYLIVRDR